MSSPSRLRKRRAPAVLAKISSAHGDPHARQEGQERTPPPSFGRGDWLPGGSAALGAGEDQPSACDDSRMQDADDQYEFPLTSPGAEDRVRSCGTSASNLHPADGRASLRDPPPSLSEDGARRTLPSEAGQPTRLRDVRRRSSFCHRGRRRANHRRASRRESPRQPKSEALASEGVVATPRLGGLHHRQGRVAA
jgi:hypothetical protein